MGHNSGDHTVASGDRQHVLHEHQIGFFAGLGRVAIPKAFRERDRVLAVVEREGWISDDAVEAHQFSALNVSWIFQSAVVVITQVGVRDAVEQQVHLGDSPNTAVLLLARQGEVAAVAAVFLDVVLGQDQHAARTAARVINAHAFARVGNLHHQAHNRPGRVELAALLAGRICEVADQVFVGSPEEIRKLEAVPAEGLLIEVHDQLTQLLIGHLRLTDLAVEVDVLQHAL
ncbi:Uncharacterised protein [Mycobacteroides abscessus subsp. abscessus]|nr:Uncharacterised protein [Mycobacteroides abscessus subsp. abscessus]